MSYLNKTDDDTLAEQVWDNLHDNVFEIVEGPAEPVLTNREYVAQWDDFVDDGGPTLEELDGFRWVNGRKIFTR